MFFPYFACVVLVSLALYGLWRICFGFWRFFSFGRTDRQFRTSLLVLVKDSQEQVEGLVRLLLQEAACEARWNELVVIDHASRDITPDILDRLALAYPEIKVIHMPADSRPAAEGIALCQGEIICLLDFISRLRPDDFPAIIRKVRR